MDLINGSHTSLQDLRYNRIDQRFLYFLIFPCRQALSHHKLLKNWIKHRQASFRTTAREFYITKRSCQELFFVERLSSDVLEDLFDSQIYKWMSSLI